MDTQNETFWVSDGLYWYIYIKLKGKYIDTGFINTDVILQATMPNFIEQSNTLIQELLTKPIQKYERPVLEPTLNYREEDIAKNIIREYLDSTEPYVAYGSTSCGLTTHYLYRYTSGELFTIYSSANGPYLAVRGSRYI